MGGTTNIEGIGYLTQEELLKFALCNGMINLDEVSQKVNMKMIDKVKEIHFFAITPPSKTAKDQRWQTYVLDETKETGRRIIKAQSEDDLYKKLAKEYGVIEDGNIVTMNDMFERWLPYKRTITNSENTIYRHVNHWKRYCKNTEICQRSMLDINTIQLESWANSLIKKHNMTRKEWQNVKVITAGIWDFAYRNGFIKANPWVNIKISVKYRQVSKKSPETQVFIGDDVEKLISVCYQMYERTNNEAYMAIIFNLYCGLRVGELVALRECDVNLQGCYFAVENEEVCIRTINDDGTVSYEWKIENHTKTYTSRYVPLIPKALDILEKIISKHRSMNLKSGFIFAQNDTHLNTNNVSNALRWACKKAGLSNKSTHKIRKTFASRLDAGGVPIDEIRVLLGHTDTQTTLGYIYNPLPKDETLVMIKNAL